MKKKDPSKEDYIDWKDYYVRTKTNTGKPPSVRNIAKKYKKALGTIVKGIRDNNLKDKRKQYWNKVNTKSEEQAIKSQAEIDSICERAHLLLIGKGAEKMQKTTITRTSDAINAIVQGTRGLRLIRGESTENVEHRNTEPLRIIFEDEDG